MMVITTSGAVTVTVVLVLTLPDVAVMTAVAGATPVTTPLPLTVAMFVAADDQLIDAEMTLPFWSLGLATSVNVAPAATVAPPETEMDVSTGVGVDVGVELSPPPEQPTSAAASTAMMRARRMVNMWCNPGKGGAAQFSVGCRRTTVISENSSRSSRRRVETRSGPG